MAQERAEVAERKAVSDFQPCTTCEMRSSCARTGRCLRPRSVEYWLGELAGAKEAMEAAVRRVKLAAGGLAEALGREGTKP